MHCLSASALCSGRLQLKQVLRSIQKVNVAETFLPDVHTTTGLWGSEFEFVASSGEVKLRLRAWFQSKAYISFPFNTQWESNEEQAAPSQPVKQKGLYAIISSSDSGEAVSRDIFNLHIEQ